MEITVNGGTANQRKYAHSMVEFCLKKLLPQHKKISIEVNFRRMTRDRCLGYCCYLEGKEFEIDLKRSLTMREMLTTLAHELVHVKQYVRGEMPESIEQGDYWDRPWEVEAHGRETGLFIRWCEKERLGHLKWTQTG
jgi:hypothetical protein